MIRELLRIGCILCLLPFAALAAETNRTPVLRGFLQSNLDGNGKAITNLLTLEAASVIATNGIHLPALNAIPTNAIPASTATHTNWVLVNLTNAGPVFVATNLAAAGSFLLRTPTTTLSAWP